MIDSKQPFRVNLAKALLKLFRVEPSGYAAANPLGFDGLLQRARVEYGDEVKSGFMGHFVKSNENFNGKSIFDLGCGYGGRTVRYAELGAKFVVGIEVTHQMTRVAAEFANEKGNNNARFITSVGEQLPFKNETFDLITSYDVLEHVQYPEATLRECFRILKSRGKMLFVFPPYFSPFGSHISGYVSMLPYANILFSPKTLMTAIDQLLEEGGSGFRPRPLRPGDKIYTLNGLTVKRFEMIVKQCGFSIRNIKYSPIEMPKLSKEIFTNFRMFAMKIGGLPLSILSFMLCSFPILKEILTTKIVCILEKDS